MIKQLQMTNNIEKLITNIYINKNNFFNVTMYVNIHYCSIDNERKH